MYQEGTGQKKRQHELQVTTLVYFQLVAHKCIQKSKIPRLLIILFIINSRMRKAHREESSCLLYTKDLPEKAEYLCSFSNKFIVDKKNLGKSCFSSVNLTNFAIFLVKFCQFFYIKQLKKEPLLARNPKWQNIDNIYESSTHF